ncbi:MAG TPA: hypothetical protein GX532_07505 [Clostridia bacterium]|jgi:hypothetical protein|nr:hypothetical protein [Clostridia bacterium]HHY06801.1 hypothetical protein [Clostridia bacterium]
MTKAIFFSGSGTSYTVNCTVKRSLEIYPATLPALRFLGRRGYLLVLVAPEFQEYRQLQTGLKDKTLSLGYWNGQKEDLELLIKENAINLRESYFITDHYYLQELLFFDWRTILVLTGKGVATLQKLNEEQLKKVVDICKDIYAAAISIALQRSGVDVL